MYSFQSFNNEMEGVKSYHIGNHSTGILSRLRKPGIATQKNEIGKFKFSRLSLNSVDRWLS